MSDGTRTPGTPEEQRRAWARLRRSLRPRATSRQLIVGVLCFLVGLSVVAQVRHHDASSLDGASQQELVRLLDESDRHVSDLESQNEDLDRTLEALQSDREDGVAAQNAAQERLEDLEILAGTTPAHGRGLVIRIGDPQRGVRASTLLGVVQELRNAGAEVIEVGGVRVVASTSVTTSAAGVLEVDGTELPVPFEILAIGDPAVMEPALKIPGGAADDIAADGGTFTVSVSQDVSIDAVVVLDGSERSSVVK
ncbi:DUF881 domain-containing protein [Brachybacterium sp. DNPG3]